MRTLETKARALRAEMDRGRGASPLYPYAVDLEPSFRPFNHEEIWVPRAPEAVRPLELGFLRVAPYVDDEFGVGLAEQLLVGLGPDCPLAFEVVGCGGPAGIQLAGGEHSLSAVAQQVLAHYRRADVGRHADLLQPAPLTVARCYRLRESHLFPLRTGHRTETYAALLGVLSGLEEGEGGVFQVLFMPVRHDWRGNILRVASDPLKPSRSAFVDLPDLPKKAGSKVSRPLFAVAVRLAGSRREVLERLEGSFLDQSQSQENALEAWGQTYPVASILARTAQVPGMLLNSEELAGLVHLPNPKETASGALRMAVPSAPAPAVARRDILVPLGVNRHRGQEVAVGIGEEWLTRHVAVFGATGYGKTNLLKLFVAVLEAGHGLAFLDPGGDAAEEFLDLVPQQRLDDVIYFDPTDRAWPPALNMLECSDEREQAMLASDLVTGLSKLFRKSWGPRLEWILRQTVSALITSRGERTLRDIPRMLCDQGYRQEVLSTVDDPDLQDFWEHSFPRLNKRGAIDPILNKVSKFVDNPLVRNVIAQPNRIDFHRILRERKVLICNLSKGRLTEEASTLLGYFILSRLQIATLARAQIPPRERGLFVILVDEFQNYAGPGAETSSIRSFLSEARKYRVALVAATQFPSQLEREVATSIFGNVGTLICLRTGVIHARALHQELGEFGLAEILDLDVGQALVRMGGAGRAFNVAIPEVRPPRTSRREEIVRRSRERYCRPRQEVERALRHGGGTDDSPAEEGPTTLEPEERLFLEHAASNPDQTVTQVASAVGFGGYKAARVRRALREGGLTVEVETRLGHGGTLAKLVVPTGSGFRAVGREPLPGRGGPVHRHFQRLIADWAQGRGYKVSTEHRIEGGIVDLHIDKPEGPTAVELSVAFRPKRELHNIRKCLGAGYPHVICLLLDEEEEQTMQRLVQEAISGEERNRLRVGSLRRFQDLL